MEAKTQPPIQITQDSPTTGQSRAIDQFHVQGDLAVICETVLTVHQNNAESWEVVDYGIPAIVANENGLQICVGDFETGDVVRRIPVNSTADYSVCKDYFHVVTCPIREGTTGSTSESATMYGLSFTDTTIAEKVVRAVKQLVSSGESLECENGSTPPAKRPKLAEEQVDIEDWVVIEKEDIPQADVAGDKQESRTDEESGEEGEEGVDAAFGTLRKSFKRKKTKVLPDNAEGHKGKKISEPIDFKHLTHVSTESTVGQLKMIISGKGAPVSAAPTTLEDKGDIEMQVSAAEPEPKSGEPVSLPMTASIDSITSTSVADSTHRRVPSETTIPPPPVPKIARIVPDPPTVSDHEVLLMEIAHFDRNKLRPVNREEIARTPNMPDSQDEHLDLNSLLKSGLDRMRSKLQLSFSRMVSITSTDDEFDDFDFPLVQN